MRYANVVRLWFRCARGSGTCRNSQLPHFGRTISSRSVQDEPDPKVVALRDKLLYCDYLDREKVMMSYKKRAALEQREKRLKRKLEYEHAAYQPVHSVILSSKVVPKAKVDDDDDDDDDDADDTDTQESERKERPLHMPYAMVDKYDSTPIEDSMPPNVEKNLLNKKYKNLYEKYLEMHLNNRSKVNFQEVILAEDEDEDSVSKRELPKGELWKVPHNWMCDYEQFDDNLINVDWYKNFGTPNPNSEVSSVPCGGCGALLHCKNPSIPGYLPSELYVDCKDNEEHLKLTRCQRCHFLKFYNAALKVNVSAKDYPKLLQVIKRKRCAIVLVVDLTDFPCSIWPNLKSIMHPFTPIFLVGNKVDLLPRDSPYFHKNIQDLLKKTVIDVTGVKSENITHVQLVSAKTGYGVEELINKLLYKWHYRGDVYMIGCTNVGKSSLFNTLLNSDYCKVQAVDLVQRATVSAWPGTTLNLLKFPILNVRGKKLSTRIARLREETLKKQQILKRRDLEFLKTGNMKLATLQAPVGRTFTGRSSRGNTQDPFTEKSHRFMLNELTLNESNPEYNRSQWCYDTPGTVQKEQILDLLTTDELMLTLPQQIITPRSFALKSKQSVFIAGMGRLDYLEGEYFIQCTLFASKQLPITICYTAYADQVYEELLQSKAFVVPVNDSKRLQVWPKLQSKELEQITGVEKESVADVVLSNIGWIAVSPHQNETASLKAWTPQGRGIYLRKPALLSKSVRLHGPRVESTPMYRLGKKVYVKV